MVKKALSSKSVINRKESKILFLLVGKEQQGWIDWWKGKLQLQIKLDTFLYIDNFLEKAFRLIFPL